MIAVMREVLVHMVRNEGYQQAVNLLYEIQRGAGTYAVDDTEGKGGIAQENFAR